MKIGKRIYYDLSTGNIVLEVCEREGWVIPTTIEQDITVYNELSERNRETFDYVELEFGEYAQDFMECNGYRVNPETKQLEFSYPDPNEPEPQEPIYRTPLSVQVEAQNQAIAELSAMIAMFMAPQGGE